MPIRPPEFDLLANELAPLLINLPPKVIAVSGSMLAGKTTFARFLAWYFNIPLIESDFYLIPNQGFTYDVSEIDRIISFRKKLSRPVIVEGFCVLKTLAEIQTPPDIVIYVQNKLDNNIDEKLDCIQDYLGFNDAAYYKLKVSH